MQRDQSTIKKQTAYIYWDRFIGLIHIFFRQRTVQLWRKFESAVYINICVILFMTVMQAVLGMSPSRIPYPDLGMGYHHGDVITHPNPTVQSYQRLCCSLPRYSVNKTDLWQS